MNAGREKIDFTVQEGGGAGGGGYWGVRGSNYNIGLLFKSNTLYLVGNEMAVAVSVAAAVWRQRHYP